MRQLVNRKEAWLALAVASAASDRDPREPGEVWGPPRPACRRRRPLAALRFLAD